VDEVRRAPATSPAAGDRLGEAPVRQGLRVVSLAEQLEQPVVRGGVTADGPQRRVEERLGGRR
jgi:hypothetical protein